MAEEYSEFAITMRGYDRAQVDRKLEQLSRQLADARREVASLDQRAMTLAGELADAQRRLRESDKPTYAGLGSRIEQLLRSAEEQSASVLSKANAEADALLTRTRTNAKNLSERSASEAATLLADARREAVVAAGGDAGNEVLFKDRADPRITRVGHWIRRLSIDELPQLINVVTGEMSLVGPRPALPEEVAAYETEARRRLLVKPGLTGLWQVSGRSDLSWESTVALDRHYVENQGGGMDVRILARTVQAVLGGRGAY